MVLECGGWAARFDLETQETIDGTFGRRDAAQTSVQQGSASFGRIVQVIYSFRKRQIRTNRYQKAGFL
jgi:hypothetical protein